MAKLFDKMFLNVILLGFAFMLVFTAFQTCGMIQKIVIDSMTIQYPSYKGDGYYSLAVVYAVFAFSNWFAPSLLSLMGSKISMILGGLMYSLFIANFFFHETWCLYLASTLIGFGASIFWTGQGSFLTINSDSETMSRNSGVFWALLQCSLLFGNIFVYFEFQGKSVIDEHTRNTVFGVLLGVACGGLVLLCFLRGGGKNSSTSMDLTSEVHLNSGPKEAFKKAFSLLRTRDMMCLAVTFLYTGFELSFFSGVYGTAVGSTQNLGLDAAKYAGMAGIFIGVGEILGGATFGILGKKTNKHGRDPIVLLGYVLHMITFFLIYINLPAKSPIRSTDQHSIINSNVYLAMFCAFGLGLGDACFNTQIYSILGSLYSEDSAPAFALFKFFQSISAAIAFFYSKSLLLNQQLLILVIFGTFGTFSFWLVEWKDYALTKEKLAESSKSSE